MGRNTRRKRLLRAQAPLESHRAPISILDLPHDVIHEILLHLHPDEEYQWHEVQDRCFVRPSRTQDLVALSGTCKALRRLYDAVQLRTVYVRNTRKDMKRTLKVLSDEKRWYVRSIVFIPDHGTSVKSRVLKKPINYAAFLAHFPNLAAVRNTTSLIPHQTSSLKPLPNLDTLDVVLPSPLLNSSTSKPPAIRKLVLRHVPHAVTMYRPSGRALARTIKPIAQYVEELWLHLDSTVVYEMGSRTSGRKKNGKKVLPALMDCVARVQWQSLRSVGLVINPCLWIPVEGELLSFAYIQRFFARLPETLERIEIHTFLSALLDVLYNSLPSPVDETPHGPSATENILRRLDAYVETLSTTLSSLKTVHIHVHPCSDDLAKCFESSKHGTLIHYAASIAHHNPPEIRHSSRWFNPADEETLQDLLRARAPAEEVEEVRDEVEELRYERWEDVEGWETEEEWS